MNVCKIKTPVVISTTEVLCFYVFCVFVYAAILKTIFLAKTSFSADIPGR